MQSRSLPVAGSIAAGSSQARFSSSTSSRQLGEEFQRVEQRRLLLDHPMDLEVAQPEFACSSCVSSAGVAPAAGAV